jgi:hypothetical protein
MSIETTLQNVELDIAAGNYDKARDRLLGLISTYPNELSLRRKLGDIYWHLQSPAMAGRYWYLEEAKTPEMETACRAFEHFCGSDALQIVSCLKFRGSLGVIQGTYAEKTLLALQDKVRATRWRDFDLEKRGLEKYKKVDPNAGKRQKWLAYGCAVIISVCLGLMMLGFYTLLMWLF